MFALATHTTMSLSLCLENFLLLFNLHWPLPTRLSLSLFIKSLLHSISFYPSSPLPLLHLLSHALIVTLIPSLFSFRPDKNVMELGDFDRANQLKEQLEEAQRARRRALEKSGKVDHRKKEVCVYACVLVCVGQMKQRLVSVLYVRPHKLSPIPFDLFSLSAQQHWQPAFFAESPDPIFPEKLVHTYKVCSSVFGIV